MSTSDRSYLYVPADNETMLDKALGRSADALILDLEDSVTPEAKNSARVIAGDWIARQTGPAVRLWVRLNPDPLLLTRDLEAVVHANLTGVYLPKVESATDLERLGEALALLEAERSLEPSTVRIAPLLETAGSIIHIPAIASAARVSHMAIGETDLAADLGMHPSPDGHELDPIRLSVVVASAANGLNPPIGPVQTAYRDLEVLRSTSMMLRRMGYGGRSAIHPTQVPVINETFSPTDSELDAARDTVKRFETARVEGAAVTTARDGSLIDEAVARKARNTIAAASRQDQES